METLDTKRKKSILNNSYKTCENLKGDDFEFYSSVKIDDVGASIYMKDSCDFDSILYAEMVDFVYDVMNNDEELKTIIEKNDNDAVNGKIQKYTQEEVNLFFEKLYFSLTKEEQFRKFFKISYIFEIISNMTNMSYDILFNLLSYDNKAITVDSFSKEVDVKFF